MASIEPITSACPDKEVAQPCKTMPPVMCLHLIRKHVRLLILIKRAKLGYSIASLTPTWHFRASSNYLNASCVKARLCPVLHGLCIHAGLRGKWEVTSLQDFTQLWEPKCTWDPRVLSVGFSISPIQDTCFLSQWFHLQLSCWVTINQSIVQAENGGNEGSFTNVCFTIQLWFLWVYLSSWNQES